MSDFERREQQVSGSPLTGWDTDGYPGMLCHFLISPIAQNELLEAKGSLVKGLAPGLSM